VTAATDAQPSSDAVQRASGKENDRAALVRARRTRAHAREPDRAPGSSVSRREIIADLRRLVTLIGLVLLTGAPAAEAKGIAQVCGADGCATVTDPGLVGPLRSTFGPAPAPKPAPFYVVRFCSTPDCRGPIDWSYLYVPSAKAMRANNIGSGPVHWMQASLLTPLVAQLTKGLEPYPASLTWTPATPRPATPTRDDAFSIAWVALAALAAVIALTLWRLGTLRRFAPG